MVAKSWLKIRTPATYAVNALCCVFFIVLFLWLWKASVFAASYEIIDEKGATTYTIKTGEDETLYQIARGGLELLYFASGIALALTVYLSVRSIRLTKFLAAEEEARQKKKFSLDLCEKYINDLHLQFKDLKDDGDKTNKQFINGCITLLNRLEIFSLSFVDGHADITIARSLIGEVFCDNAEELFQWCPPQQSTRCLDDYSYITRLIKMLK